MFRKLLALVLILISLFAPQRKEHQSFSSPDLTLSTNTKTYILGSNVVFKMH